MDDLFKKKLVEIPHEVFDRLLTEDMPRELVQLYGHCYLCWHKVGPNCFIAEQVNHSGGSKYFISDINEKF